MSHLKVSRCSGGRSIHKLCVLISKHYNLLFLPVTLSSSNCLHVSDFSGLRALEAAYNQPRVSKQIVHFLREGGSSSQ